MLHTVVHVVLVDPSQSSSMINARLVWETWCEDSSRIVIILLFLYCCWTRHLMMYLRCASISFDIALPIVRFDQGIIYALQYSGP